MKIEIPTDPATYYQIAQHGLVLVHHIHGAGKIDRLDVKCVHGGQILGVHPATYSGPIGEECAKELKDMPLPFRLAPNNSLLAIRPELLVEIWLL